MDESLKGTVNAWRCSGRKESLWRFLVRTNPWVFAHHPAKECFHGHVWYFRGLFFCKGCVMTVVGWIVAVGLQLGAGWLRIFPVGWLALSFVALLLPTVIIAIWGAARVWKHLSRVLLGVLMASSIWLFFITEHWWVRGVLVAVYFLVKIPLDRRRRYQNKKILHINAAPAIYSDRFGATRPIKGRRKS
jgi:hypothetical protein